MDETLDQPLPMRIPSKPLIASLIHQVQQGLSPVELVYTPHDYWPLARTIYCPPHADGTPTKHPPSKSLRVSVLDSSFNPPTLAHLAIVNSPRPLYKREVPPTSDDRRLGISDYDAKLLLLSVRNADKVVKGGDASLVQRLEMMALLTEDIIFRPLNISGGQGIGRAGGSSTALSHTELLDGNTAVAIIDEPTFVGKSGKLLAFVQNRLADLSSIGHTITQPLSPPPVHELELTFLLGFDTLERLLSPRYYASSGPPGVDPSENMMQSLRRFLCPPPIGEGSRVVCARRAAIKPNDLTSTWRRAVNSTSMPASDDPDVTGRLPTLSDPSPEEAVTLALAQEFIDSERVVLIDIGEREQTFSSSAVRQLIQADRAEGQAAVPKQDDDLEAKETSWRTLVSDRIATYVLKEGLYQDTERPSS